MIISAGLLRILPEQIHSMNLYAVRIMIAFLVIKQCLTYDGYKTNAGLKMERVKNGKTERWMERTHVISDSENLCGMQAKMVKDGAVGLGTIM